MVRWWRLLACQSSRFLGVFLSFVEENMGVGGHSGK
jgi:hypothetical protein